MCSSALDSVVNALAVIGTDLYAGGVFSSAGGVAANHVAKWDGTNWSALGSGASALCQGIVGDPFECGAVDSLATDGRFLYVGGRFCKAGGVDAINVARWNGTNWANLGNGLRYDDATSCHGNGAVRVLLANETEVFAGGEFWLAGGVAANNVARWDGSNWSPMGVGMDRGGGVYALAVNGTDLYAGGFFSWAGTVPSQGIAKWDRSNWSPIGSGTSRDDASVGSVGGLASNGSELFVGGSFTLAGGKPSYYIALWHIPHAVSASQSGNVLTLSWPATGTNFVLEATDNFPATNWSEVSQPPVIHNNECIVTNDISGSQKFFRLRQR